MKTTKITSENLPMKITANPSTQNTKAWIMNAQGNELEEILQKFCFELDDYIQVAADAGDDDVSNSFAKDFNNIERFYLQVKNKKQLSYNERNSIRDIMKFDTKMALNYFC